MNKIILDTQNIGTFIGSLASPYAYKAELRTRLDELFSASKRSSNRFFVLEGPIVLAAQSTLAGALNYMSDDKVLVCVQGCGRSTHVIGTNGGTMPCGAKFNGVPYYCDDCEAI